MKTSSLIRAGIILLVMVSWVAQPVWADRGRGRDKNWRGEEHPGPNHPRPDHPGPNHPRPDHPGPDHPREDRFRQDRLLQREYRENENYIFDKRHEHNRYYPRPGHVVEELPHDHRVIEYHQRRYHFHDGIWYQPDVNGFVVLIPPVGLVVPLLPPFYTTIWVGGIPYYYADGVYYVWRAEDRVYIVSDPPPEEEVVPQDKIPDQLFIYPKEGQDKEQQATDRYECHRWAVEQTSFDPTRPGGAVPADEHTGKRLDYQRAIKACLEARNYSVQ